MDQKSGTPARCVVSGKVMPNLEIGPRVCPACAPDEAEEARLCGARPSKAAIIPVYTLPLNKMCGLMI